MGLSPFDMVTKVTIHSECFRVAPRGTPTERWERDYFTQHAHEVTILLSDGRSVNSRDWAARMHMIAGMLYSTDILNVIKALENTPLFSGTIIKPDCSCLISTYQNKIDLPKAIQLINDLFPKK